MHAEEIEELLARGLVQRPIPEEHQLHFISWLKKRGGLRQIKFCEKKCAQYGLDLERMVDKLGIDILGIYRSGAGNLVVRLNDMVWADKWMRVSGLEMPHHAQQKKYL
jgi:hypothetical protein